jgi:hypothetical protein
MGLDKGDKLKIATTIGAIEVQKIIGPGTGQSATYQSFWDGQVGSIFFSRSHPSDYPSMSLSWSPLFFPPLLSHNL